MNQILLTKNEYNDYYNYLYNTNSFINKKKKKQKKYLIYFFISIIICNIILFYFLYSFFLRLTNQNKTNLIKEKYNVSSLYLANSTCTTLKLSSEISIIGLIEIPKINISYPILSNNSENLLKISVCRFTGPLPNRNGNLCIAGHNYNTTLMFSKLHELNTGDSIYITDLNNTRLEYIVYDKLNVKENDLNCTQNTIKPEITLITCKKNNNKERIVIKAKVRE